MSFWIKIRQFFLRYDIYWIAFLALALRIARLHNGFYSSLEELVRDLNATYDMFHSNGFILIGPPGSAGFSFGVIYYYLLSVFAFLFRFQPEGVLFTSVFFSIASLFVFFHLVKTWFNSSSLALWFAFLYAISMYDIQNAYNVSTPNLLPFFVGLFFLCLTKILKGERSFWTACGLGLGLGVATQLHGTALFILPLILTVAIVARRPKLRVDFVVTVLSIFILVWLPYIMFELQNQFLNFYKMFAAGRTNLGWSLNFAAMGSFVQFWLSVVIFSNNQFSLAASNLWLFWVLAIVMLALISVVLWLWRSNKIAIRMPAASEAKFLMLVWFAVGVVTFLIYQKFVYDYYFMILWSLPLVLLAWLMYRLKESSRKLFVILIIFFAVSQVVQLGYFYRQIYQPNLGHSEFKKNLTRVKKDAGDQKYWLICGLAECSILDYYLKLERLSAETVQKPLVIYVLHDRKQEESLKRYFSPKNYNLQGRLYSNYYLIDKYILGSTFASVSYE